MPTLRAPHLDPDGAAVVVTGASSGIGRATAHRLAGRGARLVLAARGREALDVAVGECRALGAEAVAVPTDVSDPDAVEALAGHAVAELGRIDAWISCAGVMAYGSIEDVPLRTQRQVVETNLLGAMHCAEAAVRRFRAHGEPAVLVNVASMLAEMTAPLISSYVASKFGLLGYSRALRRDLHGSPIAVCCVLPGSVDTPIFRNAGNHAGRATRAIPPVCDPDRVARANVRCLERPRREVRVGVIARLMAKGEVLAPPVYDRVVGPAYRFLGFTDEPAPPDDGNVFEAGPAWPDVDGGWRAR